MNLRTLTLSTALLALTAAPASAMPNGDYQTTLKLGARTLVGQCGFTADPWPDLGGTLECINLHVVGGTCVALVNATIPDPNEPFTLFFDVSGGNCGIPSSGYETSLGGNVDWTPADGAPAPQPTISGFMNSVSPNGTFTFKYLP